MKTAIKVALIAFLWIVVINNGTINADTNLRLQVTHAWVTGTEEVSPGFEPVSRSDIRAGILGVGGKRYIPYDLGQSMLMVPGDWLGTKLHPWFPKIGETDLRRLVVNFLIFVPLNVAAVVSCFWLLRLLDFEEQIAGLGSLVWLLGTTVLHYAQVHQQNNQVLLLATLGYATALAYVKRERPQFVLLSGLALGAALLIRITSVIHAFSVLSFLVGCLAYQRRDKFKVLKIAGLWLVGFVPLALLGRILDFNRYGSFIAHGLSIWKQRFYTDPIFAGLPNVPGNYPNGNPPYVGILGVLFSPAKSIFIYDPLLLPCLLIGIVFWKKLSTYIKWYFICASLDLGLHIVLTSRLAFWHGDAAWGARYHLTSGHLLLIPLIALFVKYLLTAKWLTVWVMRGIIIVAILVQISSVILTFSLESAQGTLLSDESRYLKFRLSQRVTNIICQFNSSFSENCVSRVINRLDANDSSPLYGNTKRFLARHNQFALLPFNYARLGLNRKLVFLAWGVVLTLAIGTTFWLVKSAQPFYF